MSITDSLSPIEALDTPNLVVDRGADINELEAVTKPHHWSRKKETRGRKPKAKSYDRVGRPPKALEKRDARLSPDVYQARFVERFKKSGGATVTMRLRNREVVEALDLIAAAMGVSRTRACELLIEENAAKKAKATLERIAIVTNP